jgi:hypothetical protein
MSPTNSGSEYLHLCYLKRELQRIQHDKAAFINEVMIYFLLI